MGILLGTQVYGGWGISHEVIYLSLAKGTAKVDNPDQRIDQDVDEFVGSTRELLGKQTD